MTQAKFILVLGASALVALNANALDGHGANAKSGSIAKGQYSCVFAFAGQFFDTKPIVIQDGNRYEGPMGSGTWKYSPATKQIKFNSGVLAQKFSNGIYVPAGPVPGGLKKRKGPAIVLKPSAEYKKRQGEEAVPQYCYLEPSQK